MSTMRRGQSEIILQNPLSWQEAVCPYRLIGLKGGLKLHVVPVCQDVGEGRLISAKSAFSCLTGTKTGNNMPTFVSLCLATFGQHSHQ